MSALSPRSYKSPSGLLDSTKLHNRISVSLKNKTKQPRNCKASDFCLVNLDLSCPTTTDSIYEKDISKVTLEEIYRFDEVIQHALSNDSGRNQVLIYAGLEPCRQIRVLFLLGCHLIMSQGLGFEETVLAYRPFKSLIAEQCCYEEWLEDGWRGLCCAKCLDWMDFSKFQDDQSESGIQMDEYMHYARQALQISVHAHTHYHVYLRLTIMISYPQQPQRRPPLHRPAPAPRLPRPQP
jgi:hypothetical protein